MIRCGRRTDRLAGELAGRCRPAVQSAFVAILTRDRQQRAAPHSVREIRVPIATERVKHVSGFYAGMLGLRTWPTERQMPGAWGAGDLLRGILFEFRHDPVVDPMRRRFTITVSSLEQLATRLEEAQWPFQWRRGFFWSDQHILLTDPTGHWIEIRQVSPL
jgi:hypothetical protein